MELTRLRRSDQLTNLAEALRRLVAILGHAPNCQWRSHFENCLTDTGRLLTDGFKPSDITALSNSVRHVYGGSGSFSDYVPIEYDSQLGVWKPISGTEPFAEASGDVYHWAEELRVIGRY